jgi:hypothetical protein
VRRRSARARLFVGGTRAAAARRFGLSAERVSPPFVPAAAPPLSTAVRRRRSPTGRQLSTPSA